MSTFKELFESYGVNYKTYVELFMESEKMYLKFLDMFFQDPNLKLLEEALQENNLTKAFDAAHTLKGVAGNMGLTPLYGAVCAIVEPLRSGEQNADYEQLYQTILSEYQRVKQLQRDLMGGERR